MLSNKLYEMTTLAVVLILLTLTNTTANINPVDDADGVGYFQSPLYCNSMNLVLASYLSKVRSTYTPRDNVRCCYREDAKSSCCVETDSSGAQICKCSPSIACGIPTTTTTTTTTTTPRPTTTTTRATTTTTRPTTTTTRATTTTTRATTTSSTTRAPTTTSTTTKAPTTTSTTTKASTTRTTPTTTSTTTASTTTAPKSLCPQPTYRILNGQKVDDDCPYHGVSNVTIFNGDLSACNAVFTIAPVDGVMKPTFLTSPDCVRVPSEFSTDGGAEIQIGKKKYAVTAPTFRIVSYPNGTAFFDVNKDYQSLFNDFGGCQTSACGYNKATMAGKVDLNNCKILSFGTSDDVNFVQNGLNEVAVKSNPGGCADVKDQPGVTNTLCFKAVSGQPLICSNDSGSPLFCFADLTKEWILMGVAIFQIDCAATSEAKIIPFPA